MLRPGIVGMRGSYGYGSTATAVHGMSLPPAYVPPCTGNPTFHGPVRSRSTFHATRRGISTVGLSVGAQGARFTS